MPVSPYVTNLRSRLGHALLLLPGVAVLPRDDVDRLLLVRGADTGQWGTIGGGIEADESPEDAAKREVLEETGLEVELGAILGAFGGPAYRVTYPNGDAIAYVTVAYDARVTGGTEALEVDEVTELAWHDAHDSSTWTSIHML